MRGLPPASREGIEVSSDVHLDNASVEAISHRVVELLRGKGIGGELIDAVEVARRFGCSRDWVYENADRLGVVRLSDGPKAHLRFDPRVVTEYLNTTASHKYVTPQRANQSAVRSTPSTDLLPIKGESS